MSKSSSSTTPLFSVSFSFGHVLGIATTGILMLATHVVTKRSYMNKKNIYNDESFNKELEEKGCKWSGNITGEKKIVEEYKWDKKLIVCTRIHVNSTEQVSKIDNARIINFINSAKYYADEIIICASIHDIYNPNLIVKIEDIIKYKISLENVKCMKVIVLPITPWGKFVNALNSAIHYASWNKYDLIMFQSLETILTPPPMVRECSTTAIINKNVAILLKHMDMNDTLSVGCYLNGHIYSKGMNEMNGRTCPWNTCCIWNVKKLSLTGFLSISDGTHIESDAGVEEIIVCCLLQRILGQNRAKVKMIKFNDDDNKNVAWDAKWEDDERKKWHEKKMSSKMSRAESQILSMRIKPGKVIHI